MPMSDCRSAKHYDLEVVRVPNFKAIIVHSVESIADCPTKIADGKDAVDKSLCVLRR
jgi:hypothetical protein